MRTGKSNSWWLIGTSIVAFWIVMYFVFNSDDSNAKSFGSKSRDSQEINSKSNFHEFKLMSQQFYEHQRHLWPKNFSCDLVIRTASFAADVLLINFESLEIFWPDWFGQIILILDKKQDDEERKLGWFISQKFKPGKIKIIYETYGIAGAVSNQYSNFISDEYSNAKYISFFDADCVLQTFITPDTFFDESGRLKLLANKDWQREFYEKSTKFLIGSYAGNFMIQLPITIPRSLLPELRKKIMSVQKSSSFSSIFVQFSDQVRDMSQFCVIGAFAASSMEDEVIVIDETDRKSKPIIRVGSHLPYHFGEQKKSGGGYFMRAYEVLYYGIQCSFTPFSLDSKHHKRCIENWGKYSGQSMWNEQIQFKEFYQQHFQSQIQPTFKQLFGKDDSERQELFSLP